MEKVDFFTTHLKLTKSKTYKSYFNCMIEYDEEEEKIQTLLL